MRIIIRWNGCQNIHINFRFRSLHALDIQNLSNRCRNSYDQSISRIFLILFFGVFLLFSPTVRRKQLISNRLARKMPKPSLLLTA